MSDSTNRTLLTIIIIIGIIALIIFVASPRTRVVGYGYRSGYAASAYDAYPVYNASGGTDTSNTVYSIHRSIPSPHTDVSYASSSYYSSYNYPQYVSYPDGCDATTLYSATTGMPCNSY